MGKNLLAEHLSMLLRQPTSVAQLELLQQSYLRLQQKVISQEFWLENMMHNGAHFPLCVHTNNVLA